MPANKYVIIRVILGYKFLKLCIKIIQTQISFKLLEYNTGEMRGKQVTILLFLTVFKDTCIISINVLPLVQSKVYI